MNTLIQNTAGLFIPFYNQYIVYAAPFRSYCRCQACRAGSHNQNVSVHVTPCCLFVENPSFLMELHIYLQTRSRSIKNVADTNS